MPVQDNNLLTDNVISKESLRLLKNNLVTAKLVFRNYEKTFGKVGDSINLRLPFRVKASDGRVLEKQPLVDRTIPFKINKQHHIGLEYTVKDKTLDIMDFSERYLKSGMIQIANKIDQNILLTLKKAYHSSGVPGVRPGKFIDFALAGAAQTSYAVPNDGLRNAIIDPFTCATLSDEVTKLFKESMVESSFKMGYKGDVASYKVFESQNLPRQKVGNYSGTILIDGNASNGDTIKIKGGAPDITGFLNIGDVFTVAGVFSVNPQNYTTTGILQEFVVLETVNTDTGGLATIKVSPTMNDGSSFITNESGEQVSLKAYQNITTLPKGNAIVTIFGTPNATYEQNYLFHRDAVALAMIDLELPQTAVVKSRASDPISGLSLVLTGAYDINQQSEIHRIDVVYGTDLIYGDLAMRLWGGNS